MRARFLLARISQFGPNLTFEQSQPLVRNPLQTHWRSVLGGGSAPEPRAIYLGRIGCCLSFGSYNANLSSQISVLTVARVHLGNCWGAVCVSLRFPTDAESFSPDRWIPCRSNNTLQRTVFRPFRGRHNFRQFLDAVPRLFRVPELCHKYSMELCHPLRCYIHVGLARFGDPNLSGRSVPPAPCTFCIRFNDGFSAFWSCDLKNNGSLLPFHFFALLSRRRVRYLFS